MSDESQRLKKAAADLLAHAEALEQETRVLAAVVPYPEKEIARKLKLAGIIRAAVRTLQSAPDNMVEIARLRHSVGQNRRAENRLVQAANEAGYTLRSLAEEIGVSHAYLSQAAAGLKRIRYDLAERVAVLTARELPNGKREFRYAATLENWPKGWIP